MNTANSNMRICLITAVTALHKLDWDKATKNKILKKFDKIGVIPVVIPLRSEYDFFKNPLTLALNA